jgi:hypothetical protein
MKTFADIKWKSHKSDPKAIQGLLPLSGGAELSVVAGDWMYCTPKKSLGNPDLHSSFEIAFFDKDGDFINDILGWQTREDINALLSNYSS